MEKVGAKKKPRRKTNKTEQYERFQQTARELGVGIDDEKNAKAFDEAFRRIVPARKKSA